MFVDEKKRLLAHRRYHDMLQLVPVYFHVTCEMSNRNEGPVNLGKVQNMAVLDRVCTFCCEGVPFHGRGCAALAFPNDDAEIKG